MFAVAKVNLLLLWFQHFHPLSALFDPLGPMIEVGVQLNEV